MTNQNHPITPPPELLDKWRQDWYRSKVKHIELEDHIATQATRWGADQELEACCQYISGKGEWFVHPGHRLAELRAARRPKPPSLKEQAQAELDRLIALIPTEGAMAMAEPIRRALEALPND